MRGSENYNGRDHSGPKDDQKEGEFNDDQGR